jgi:hypothetical protein
MEKCFVFIGARSVARMISRPTFLPSPQHDLHELEREGPIDIGLDGAFRALPATR